MKGRVAMTTSALKGLNSLNAALPTFPLCWASTCEDEFKQASSVSHIEAKSKCDSLYVPELYFKMPSKLKRKKKKPSIS